MAGCASCGGCCAQCASTCGAFGGASLGAFGGLGGSGFSYFTSNHPLQDSDDGATQVDGDALIDHRQPGHRGAIKSISHVDHDTHEKITQWLNEEMHRMERGRDPQT